MVESLIWCSIILVNHVPTTYALSCIIAPVKILAVNLFVLGFAHLGLNEFPSILLVLSHGLPIFVNFVSSLFILEIPPFYLTLPSLLDLLELDLKLFLDLEATLEFFQLC